MLDLRPYVRPGRGVWWGQAGAEARPLVDALLDRAPEIGDVHAFCGLSLNRRLRDLPPQIRMCSYGAMGELRATHRSGRLDIVPAHYSALPSLFAERLLPVDVGLVQVAPPGPDGVCSLGIGVDYVADALPHSGILIGEINTRMPAADAPGIPLARFDATVETDRPLPQAPDRAPDPVDRAIARRVAELVSDGDTLQLGVGSLPGAVLQELTGHRDLGLHSGMIGDGVLPLLESGVLTGARKEIDPGRVVAGTAVGSRELYDRIPELPVSFRPASYTHAPGVLARFRRLVSVNSALQVDLQGQVGAESTGGRHIGGIGGQADFSGAAARSGGLSIIALRSTTAGGTSTIVHRLDGPVTTGRPDVDVVVTEHGVAWLRGAPSARRPARLAAVAAPGHRDALLRTDEEDAWACPCP
ncbi:acetyl-CoA hydrolase/transferase family protein [Pseudonocardia endophytica]|uniref:Acyl-CoA hydrolase n=1 Tax=Pseudonocardia endophytica TaxID=401976 RepID=A0A4R1HUG9_PSEEN|nr:acetyl-CoA hydrolase/transferase C-terminal domain-containing protein [Pseudonocardia endophytica]TCK26347.1 acyl-CoA hydrolase [Pseudonocardia endophytica]